jgi:hypothetical protein
MDLQKRFAVLTKTLPDLIAQVNQLVKDTAQKSVTTHETHQERHAFPMERGMHTRI